MEHLVCPNCTERLSQTVDGKSLQCINGHSFDRAKQGYVNLLLSHQKKSKNPGDSTEMVAARSQFLDLGFYAPLSNHIAESSIQLRSNNEKQKNFVYLDIACGEGYYTHAISEALQHKKDLQNTPEKPSASAQKACFTYGLDISQPAIKKATQRNKAINWLVASASSLPFDNETIDFASCLFCREYLDEAARVIKPGGKLLIARTGPRHLIEMREHLYDEIIEKQSTAPQGRYFSEIAHTNVSYQITLGSSLEIQHLLKMTPHFWKSRPEKKQALFSLESLSVTLDVDIYSFEKR